MSLITDGGSLEAEDQSYLSVAIENVKKAKDFLRKNEYSTAAYHAEKAFKQSEAMYQLRKDVHPDYQVLLAPFYYFLGNVLSIYL